MKTWKIKYQSGSNILITEIEAISRTQAMTIFYIKNPNCDIISILEKSEENG